MLYWFLHNYRLDDDPIKKINLKKVPPTREAILQVAVERLVPTHFWSNYQYKLSDTITKI